jgi:choline dehydrogenase-like flavoprotein
VSFVPDIIILGSGPAGVSAAFPLVDAGLNVLMIDVGYKKKNTLKKSDTFFEMHRTDSKQCDIFVGKKFDVFKSKGPSSPKIKAPTNHFVFRDYTEKYKISSDNFTIAGSLSAGGLSNAWGAGVSYFDDVDLKDYPISASSLESSYKAITDRIGVSGLDDDMGFFHGKMNDLQGPLNIDENSRSLLKRYKVNSKRAHSQGIIIGRNRHAVISTSKNGREPCQYCGLCLWGCAYQSIYNSVQDLSVLKKKPNFQYRNNVFVKKIVKKNSGYVLQGIQVSDSTEISFYTEKLVLACGTVGSAKLVLEALHMYDKKIQLLSAPTMAFAMFLPEKVGRSISENGFAMGQLSFKINDDNAPERYSFGSTIPANTILASELLQRVPLSYPLSRNIIRFIHSSLLLGNCFLSGSYGNHKMHIGEDGNICIKGSYSDNLYDSIKQIRRRLTKVLMSYGIFLLPGGFQVTSPGEDIHYAGTLPMKKEPKPHETTSAGEVAGLPGVYVVDGAVLTSLPAKSHTLTIMANADRIGKILGKQING